MSSRLAGTLSLLACLIFGWQAPVAAQPGPYAQSSMPEYTPRWAMPQPGMPGMSGPAMAGPPGMQAAYQDAYDPTQLEAPADAGPAGCGPGCAAGCGCGAGAGGGAMGGPPYGPPGMPPGQPPYEEDRMGRRRIFAGGGGGGRGPRGNPGGLLGDAIGFRWLRFFLPDDDGGACAVRWFDIGADFVYFVRDNRAPDRVVSEFGFNQGLPALSLQDIDFNESAGFRFYANIQLGSASSLEFAYLGPLHNRGTAFAADPQGQLTSIVSDFANFPFGQGFAETDFATLHQLVYTSELDSFELNYRNRWVAPECRYQGSWLVGARYLKLDEDLHYVTLTQFGAMDFNTNTNNSLTGLQIGGDLWITPLPGLRFGAEAKAGIFGNHMNVSTDIATTQPAFFGEKSISGYTAFVGELDVKMTYRLNYHWTLRLGYNFLWMDGLALAADNFNPTLPNVFAGPAGPNGPPRVPVVDRTGDALFHGLNVGLEYLW